MSAYKIAMSRTTQTIDNRARYFRNQVVAVVIVGMVSIVGAMVAWTLWPLTGLLLLVPICGMFSLFDGKLLNDWRSHLLASWAKQEVDFWGFRAAMEAIPTLPKATLQSMLDTLPSTPNWDMERAASQKTRGAVAAIVTAIHACHADTVALKVVGSAIAAVSVFCAAALKVWFPLLFIGVILSLPLLLKWMRRWRLRKLQASIVAAQPDPDFNAEAFEGLINHLDWRAMSTEERNRVTAAVLSEGT